MSGIPAGAGQLLGKRLGKFEILALLALGGTAEIYLARIDGAAGFEKYVVVKCLHDHLADDTEFVKMFLDEARLAAHLDHSNIVQTMELGRHEGRYYMVMEFLAGLSLAMIIRRAAERMPNGKIPVPLVLNMLAQACAGLHYAHEKAMNGKPLNIVHRDISPQNLVVSFEGVVKVVDFGIAKAEMRETRTRSGTIKGKFAYMSPEQCVANNVDRRTDVFALGVIGHELLTGQRLFKRPSPYETYQAVMECDVKPPSQVEVEVDPALDAIIMKAVAKAKDDRYPSAEAFGDALLGYLHHRGKGSGHGDVSRYFDAHFVQELEEHGARMRELISGRDISVDTGGSWDSEEEIEKRANQTVDIVTGRGSDRSIPLGTSELDLADLGEGARNEDDELPAEKTRIESNPLDRINELDAVVSKSQPIKRPTATPPTAAPIVAQPKMPPSGPLPLPAPPTAPLSRTPQPRFSELANLPTMVAEPDDDPDPDSPQLARTVLEQPELAKTQLGAQPLTPLAPLDANGPRSRQPTPGRPVGQVPRQHPSSSVPPLGSAPAAPVSPGGYPVVNRELSAQIAAGATVFPGRPSGPMAPPRVGESGPQAPIQRTPDGGNPMQPMMADPQRAANMMSPVGQQYPEQVDWAAAAAAPARAVPPWLLAALFIGALALALMITILIARIIR